MKCRKKINKSVVFVVLIMLFPIFTSMTQADEPVDCEAALTECLADAVVQAVPWLFVPGAQAAGGLYLAFCLNGYNFCVNYPPN